MDALRPIKMYQLLELLTHEGTTDATTIADIRILLMDGKEYPCPQCGRTGTIDADLDTEADTECPTCSGDGYTATAYEIDRAQSTIIYKPIS